MKVGFSFGRCIRDIVDGNVDINDVAWIISSTAMRDDETVDHVIEDYTLRPDYLAGRDLDKCKEVAFELFHSGRVLQPRLQGVHRHKVPVEAVWADLFPTTLAESETAKKAWDNYRFMLHMTDSVPEDVKDHWK